MKNKAVEEKEFNPYDLSETGGHIKNREKQQKFKSKFDK